jgi:uroporphyrinogen-III decarboxylase
MNIPFDIVKGKGPVIYDPLRTAAAVNEVREFLPEEWVPYVGQALNLLRDEVSIHFSTQMWKLEICTQLNIQKEYR